MEALISKQTKIPINVFLIGNNPIELGTIYEKLKSIKSRAFKMELSFDMEGLFKRIVRFNPACILIDDNLEKLRLQKILKRLSSHRKTKGIAIAILKNSNYQDSHLEEAQEFLLKENITTESLSRSIHSSIRFKKMNEYLYRSFNIGKSRVSELLHL